MRRSLFALLLLPLLIAADCKEAELSLPSHIRSVAIPTFANRTNRAGLEFDVTQRVLHEFMSSSKLAVKTSVEEADAVILGEIYDYQRTPISWDQTNRIVQYKIRIFARVEFVDRVNNVSVWKENTIDGITSYSTVASPPETEESAIFKAADELARDIFFLVFEQRQHTADDLLFSDPHDTSGVRPGEVGRRK